MSKATERRYNVDNSKGLTHLSLCSGYDGIGLGLEGAGFDIEFTIHVEIEAYGCFNLVRKIETGALGEGLLFPNLKTFPFKKFRGLVDILSGGFPCQPFSQAGKGHGDTDPRHLFPFIKQGIADSQPGIVVLENVEGIVSSVLKGDNWNDPAGTPVLLHVIRELERVGYRATAVATSASEVGAPHQRNRWFIIGAANHFNVGCQRSLWTGETGKEGTSFGHSTKCCTAWPTRPGQHQYGWEPPRVVGDGSNKGCSQQCEPVEAGKEHQRFEQPSSRCERPETQPPMGGNLDGTSGGMDYAELCVSSDNRTDELRLLGNGVVPQSCTDAVIRGLQELGYA